ncbi:MAG: hypothetical protein KC613_18210 [Myxococcales bacterium]|nr:hypothetical protein [Myxococcales bacterium]MCB9526355.1 hypothetical protein [Myxococcales bacterium]
MRKTLLITLLALTATPALAENHFLLELEAGGAAPIGLETSGDVGRTYGGTFGFGGRIKGFAPAYYLVGRLDRAEFGFDGPANAGAARVERCQSGYTLAGRMYLPVTERFRLLLQLGFGQIFDESEVRRDGLDPLVLKSDAFTVSTQVGFQYRLNDTLSLGASGDMTFLPDREDIDHAAKAAGLDDSGFMRMRLVGTATVHF